MASQFSSAIFVACFAILAMSVVIYEARLLKEWCRMSIGCLLGAGTRTHTTVRVPGASNICRVRQIYLGTSWVWYGHIVGMAWVRHQYSKVLLGLFGRPAS
ncbi:unnamed protein product [Camellia sinensis]